MTYGKNGFQEEITKQIIHEMEARSVRVLKLAKDKFYSLPVVLFFFKFLWCSLYMYHVVVTFFPCAIVQFYVR